MSPSPAIHRPIALELRIRTPHGIPVPGATVIIHGGGLEIAAIEQHGVYRLALPTPGDYQLVVQRFQRPGGFDHRTLRAALFYTHTSAGPALRHLGELDGARTRIDRIEPAGAADFALDVTLDYLFFTPIGYPPTAGNHVELLVDGDAGWGAVAQDLRRARASVHLTTWIYQPSTELERPRPLTSPEERAPYTVQELLESQAAAGARVRMLLWDAPFLRMPRDVRRVAGRADDRFEALEQPNPTERPLFPDGDAGLLGALLGELQIGSYHQKTVVVDGRVGFCGGMNLKENDWDSRLHRRCDARRCRFDRDAEHRARVDRGELPADYRPRHDFMARLEGPAVEHLERNFQQRWNWLIDQEAPWSHHATRMPDPPPQPALAGGVQVQVVRTMPEPFRERGILDSHLRALQAARRLIYIEDQYFRSTHVSDAIADAVRTWPGLHLVVVTQRSQADDLLAGGWTRAAFERIQRRRPDFVLHTLMVDGEEVDNHAKLMIVDDLFLSVGSCNINDRGFEYEGEINVAVVDAGLVRCARLDIWREHLAGDPRLSGDIDRDAAVWHEHAAHNRRALDDPSLRPRSAVVPFEPRADRRALTAADVV